MEPRQVVQNERERANVGEFELPDAGKCLVQQLVDLVWSKNVSASSTKRERPLTRLGILPVELPDKLQDFVDRLLDEDIVDQMPDEELHRRALLLLDGQPLGRVALYMKEERVRKKQTSHMRAACAPGSRRSRGAVAGAGRDAGRSAFGA